MNWSFYQIKRIPIFLNNDDYSFCLKYCGWDQLRIISRSARYCSNVVRQKIFKILLMNANKFNSNKYMKIGVCLNCHPLSFMHASPIVCCHFKFYTVCMLHAHPHRLHTCLSNPHIFTFKIQHQSGSPGASVPSILQNVNLKVLFGVHVCVFVYVCVCVGGGLTV